MNINNTVQTTLLKNSIKHRTFGTRECIICHNQFVKLSPRSKTCGKSCRVIFYQNIMKQYRVNNKDRIRSYNQRRHNVNRLIRLQRRRLIKKCWGHSTRAQFRHTELHVINHILPNEGFTNIYNANQLMPHSPFDIIAKKNGHIYAIQVTQRDHINKTPQSHFAKALGVKHIVIFISPNLQHYIIKSLENRGNYELNLRDLKSVGLITN